MALKLFAPATAVKVPMLSAAWALPPVMLTLDPVPGWSDRMVSTLPLADTVAEYAALTIEATALIALSTAAESVVASA